MSAMTLEDAQALFAEPNPIAVGARGDDERRRRHGTKTTFVRVLDVHLEAIPASLPASAAPGEIRLTGKPASVAAAIAAVQAVRALAGRVPVAAWSLADLLALSGGTGAALTDLAGRLAAAGLSAIAETPLDLVPDAAGAIRAARDGGLQVLRLTVHEMKDERLRLLTTARELQQAIGGIHAFAPLPRHSSIAQPSTGYDDVKTIAAARLVVDNIESIQVDWALYGPKLAQVALTVGADDVDGVSALEGDLGRRRSPLEEIRGNIKAAGLEPVERNGLFEPLVNCE